MFFKSVGQVSSKNDKFSQIQLIEFDRKTLSFNASSSIFLMKLDSLQVEGTHLFDRHGMNGRADVLSFDIYDTSKLWWVLLRFNKLKSFKEVEVGKTYKYPSKLNIENLILSLRETDGLWLY
jgi:hypothetical protein